MCPPFSCLISSGLVLTDRPQIPLFRVQCSSSNDGVDRHLAIAARPQYKPKTNRRVDAAGILIQRGGPHAEVGSGRDSLDARVDCHVRRRERGPSGVLSFVHSPPPDTPLHSFTTGDFWQALSTLSRVGFLFPRYAYPFL